MQSLNRIGIINHDENKALYIVGLINFLHLMNLIMMSKPALGQDTQNP